MAVPLTGPLSQLKLAREAKHADYNGSQSMGVISLYDLVNGGQANGSTVDYPAVNTNCTPNPANRTANYAELKQVYKRVSNVVTGPFTHYFDPAQAINACAINTSTVIYTDSALTTPVGAFGGSSALTYWYQDVSGLLNTDKMCCYNYGGNWDTDSNSKVINLYCGQ